MIHAHGDRFSEVDDYNLYDLLDTEINSTRHYMLLMYALARANELMSMVELGCFIGNTTAVLARAAQKNNGHVWAIDNDYDGGSIERSKRHIECAGLENYVTFVKGNSWESPVPRWADLVFVDAQHDFDAVDRDWCSWGSRVAPGGYMFFHDVGYGELSLWVASRFPCEGWESIMSPGDCGLLIARRCSC
jgi:predicted O-methyltransferase YrrM